MNRKQADIAAAVLVASILIIGVFTAVRLALADDAMMGRMGPPPAVRWIGPVLMSLVVASVVGGVYVFVRGQVFGSGADTAARTAPPTDDGVTPDPGNAGDGTQGSATDREDAEVADREDAGVTDRKGAGATDERPDLAQYRHVLDVLPDDERAILEPVVESPGLTQIEVRDRSDFSKSKVSQTVTDLEKRGLLYRESQGRTYRVYPADDLDERV